MLDANDVDDDVATTENARAIAGKRVAHESESGNTYFTGSCARLHLCKCENQHETRRASHRIDVLSLNMGQVFVHIGRGVICELTREYYLFAVDIMQYMFVITTFM